MDRQTEAVLKRSRASRLALEFVKRDFDFALTVNIAERKIAEVLNDSPVEIFTSGADYKETASRLINEKIKAADPEKLIKETCLETVLEKLLNSSIYEFRFFGNDLNGTPFIKELSFRYRDALHRELFVACRDITDLPEGFKNKSLTDALNNAVKANTAKSDFLSRMSHDMRTPLNGVIGMTELALKEENPEKIHEYLQQVRISGKFLLGLINDVLDMVKIENGRLELHPEPYSQKEFLEYINAVAAPLCAAKNQKFEVKIDKFSRAVMADKLRFNQIFFNLLSNASKYTPEGGTVRFSIHRCTSGLETVYNKVNIRYKVEDTGIGISKAFLDYIFEPFTREETGTTAQTQGTGLGLSIVNSLVQMMHGQIKIESEPGKGTTATVNFVLSLAPDGSEDGAVDSTENAKPKENFLKGKRVLVAEDNNINARLMEAILKKREIISEHAENGKAVVEMFMENEMGYYDAILMDVRMPIMDGIRASQAIRKLTRPDAAQVPIIAVTANAFDKDVEDCLAAGMNAHLGKPIEAEKVFSILEEYCAIKPDYSDGNE